MRRSARIVGAIVAIVVAVALSFGVRQGMARYQKNRQRDAQAAEWGLDRPAADRIQAYLDREMKPLLESPLLDKRHREMVAANKGQPVDVKGLARTTVAQGLARLPDSDLLALHALRKRTVFASDRACPCYWDPTSCSEGDVVDGIARLTDPELTAWMRLSVSAGLAELNSTTPLPATRSDFDTGVRAMLDRLPAAESEPLLRAMSSTQGLTRKDHCAAIRAIFKGADALPEEERLKFVRAFANLGAKG